MLNYEDLENDIIDKLNGYLTANSLATIFEARVFPETESAMQGLMNAGLNNTKCWFLVIYNGSNFGDERGTSFINHDENITIRLIFLAAKERGENGIFKMLQHAKIALTGYQPTNCSKKMKITAQEMLDFMTLGVRYSQDYSTETKVIENVEYPETILATQTTEITYR